MQDGASNPMRDSAAKAASRSAAISAAMSGDGGNEIDDDYGSDQQPLSAALDEPAGEVSQDAESEPAPIDSTTGAPQGEPGLPTAPTAGAQLQAPATWPKDRQTEFNALPDNAKRILLARDKEYSQGITKNAQDNADHRKRSEAITEILKPFDADLRAANLDHPGAVRWMVQERAAFNQDPGGFLLGYLQKANVAPEQFIQHLIQRSGLTADQLFRGQPASQQQPAADPAQDEWKDPTVIALEQQIAALKNELNPVRQTLAQFQQQFQQQETLSIQEEIAAFQSSTDASGQPAYPHYETVKPVMKMLIETDPEVSAIPDRKAQEKLKAAYEKAVWLVPEIRQQLIDAQVNQSVTTQVSQQVSQASLEKAKAARTLKGSPGANAPAVQGRMGRKDAVAAALRQFGGE